MLGWQWCDTEKKAAWAALLARFPAPTVVITDVGSGIAAALSECWSESAVQRCLVHVQRNVRTYLTGRPGTEADRTLPRLEGPDEDRHRGVSDCLCRRAVVAG